jgi:Tfp pilus assembly protein PilX
MKKTKSTLSNDKGSVLVIALIMLALLTTLGIMSTNTTSIDLQIAQNERLYSDYFNRAEAAAMHAMQRVADADANDLKNHGDPNFEWLINGEVSTANWNSTEEALTWFRDPDNWVYPTAADADPDGQNAETLATPDNTRFAVVDTKMEGQSEEEGAADQIHVFHCFGLYRPDDPSTANQVERGEILVEVGFRRRI